MLIAFGIIFQMPVLVFTLAKLGLVTAGFLWRNTKYAIFLIFVIAAFITPPDVISQVLMAAPMTLLYVISIGIAWMFGPKADRDETGAPSERGPLCANAARQRSHPNTPRPRSQDRETEVGRGVPRAEPRKRLTGRSECARIARPARRTRAPPASRLP
jgi:sec-independent protein translocase protein TatC